EEGESENEKKALRKRGGLCEPKLGFSLSPIGAKEMTLLQSLPGFGRRLRAGRATGLVAPLACLLLFSPARATAESAFDGEFSVQRFDPAPGPRNYFSTRGLRMEGNMSWSAGLVMNYANDPFVVASCAGLTDCSNPSGVPGRKNDVHVV